MNPAPDNARRERSPPSGARRSAGLPDLDCPRCGYSLNGLESLRCPECNTLWTIDADRRARGTPLSRAEVARHCWRAAGAIASAVILSLIVVLLPRAAPFGGLAVVAIRIVFGVLILVLLWRAAEALLTVRRGRSSSRQDWLEHQIERFSESSD